MGARASTEDRDLGLDVLDVIVGRFEIDLRRGSLSAVVVLAQQISSHAATYMFDGDYLARGLLDALVDHSKTTACAIKVLVAKSKETEATGGVCVRPSSSRTWYWPARASSVMLKIQGRSHPLSHE